MSKCEIKDKIYVDGRPFQILSGAIHYFRVVPEYWQDRLEKLKSMGCNTVETYIPWNFHETEKGHFLWDGMHDVFRFIETAQNLGLYIIIRPSPYICAEWEWGGLPAFLLKESDIHVRCSDPAYLKHVTDYYSVLIPKLVPYQIDNGGKVILIQVENEYGYYGDDASYLQYLADLMRKLGITVPFVTSDGPWNRDVFCSGQLEGVLPAGNFGSDCKLQFSQMKKMMKGDFPLMNMEFWAGWFDAWGNEKKKYSDLKANIRDYEYAVSNGHCINIYMFHGGTNFGFMNGSNYGDFLTSDTSSYDYDAPLTEYGGFTEKYHAFREIIRKHLGNDAVPPIVFSTKITCKSFGTFEWNRSAGLFENIRIISRSMTSVTPVSMEKAGQSTGYILYKTKMKTDEKALSIVFKGCADRVQCFSDGKKLFTAFDREICSEKKGSVFSGEKIWNILSDKGAELDFLVENAGRVNFGHKLEEQSKGLSKNVLINTHAHFNWEMFPLPLDEEEVSLLLEKGLWKSSEYVADENPAFFSFDAELSVPDAELNSFCDTFLDFSGWGKGCVWVNGFNIGRFWDIGPQKKLYIPGPLLHPGKNSILIFETEGKRKKTISLDSDC